MSATDHLVAFAAVVAAVIAILAGVAIGSYLMKDGETKLVCGPEGVLVMDGKACIDREPVFVTEP